MTSRNLTDITSIRHFFSLQNHLYMRVFTPTIFRPFIEHVIKYYQENDPNRRIYITTLHYYFVNTYQHLFPVNTISEITKYGNSLTPGVSAQLPILYIHHTSSVYDSETLSELKTFLHTHPNIKMIYVEEKLSIKFPNYFLYNLFRYYFHFEMKIISPRRRWRRVSSYHFDQSIVPDRTRRSIANTYYRQNCCNKGARRARKNRDYTACVDLLQNRTMIVKYNERLFRPPGLKQTSAKLSNGIDEINENGEVIEIDGLNIPTEDDIYATDDKYIDDTYGENTYSGDTYYEVVEI